LALTPLSGRFYRIVLRDDLARLLNGAKSPEGRFHHHGQSALYLSPTPEAAGHAVAPYLRAGDGPRVVAPLRLTGARICDLRVAATRTTLGLAGHEADVPWLPEREAGLPTTTWIASDAARAQGADGMIYTARSAPARWHLVLFRWNVAGAAHLTADGAPFPFAPNI
jgi:RES domain-containing protein